MASSALLYQIQRGTVGVPLAFPTKSGPRCGHFEPSTTPSGNQGYKFYRDPNVICGLPVKKADVAACGPNGQQCSPATLPPGWSQVGQSAVNEPHPRPVGRIV